MNLEQFKEKIRKEDLSSLSKFAQMFSELVLRAPKAKAKKLVEALPETVKEITKTLGVVKKKKKKKNSLYVKGKSWGDAAEEIGMFD
tara:strand:- start:210 stop:470 length:261 start_codon:yes stop_codon:yes gene_type:complete